MKKKLVAVMTAALCTMSMLAACGNSGATTSSTEGSTTGSAGTTNTAVGGVESASYTVGISQFAEHGSLDNCREGFLAGLAEAGIEEGKNLTVIYDNAQTDTASASTIADSMVSQKADLICAIATPSAMSAYNSCMNTDIPVVYTAVSDPVASGLAKEDGSSVGNITGTSDYLPVTAQLEMIRKVLPDATKIGIIYTTSETNSVSTLAEYEKYAPEYGFTIVSKGINQIGEVEMAAKSLVSEVDCITNMADNTVVSALQVVLAAATEKNIPVFGSEVEQVKAGCVASMGLEYYELGMQTGAMAAKILKGEAKASEMNFEVITEPSLYVNTAAAEKIGLNLEKEFVDGAYESFDSIVVE
ncbi:MAG: ABC transporter substrate-binding protein [Lachnospiraceae bacterium]|nr:ABC transporter substrate-binding protein [Lachnospiraceae bacterium]